MRAQDEDRRQTIFKRIITGVILGVLALSAILFLSVPQFALLSFLVLLFASWEWSRLAGWKKFYSRFAYIIGLCAVLCLVLYGYFLWASKANLLLQGFLFLFPLLTLQQPHYLILAAVFWIGSVFFIVTYPETARVWGRSRLLKSLIGYLVLILGWLSLIALRAAGGPWLVLLMLFGIWGADTGAYFAGIRWGKTRRKLLPKVSPKKSYAGLLGGIITTIIVILAGGLIIGREHLFLIYSPQKFPIPVFLVWLMLSGLWISVFAVIGDLLESMLKRNIGIKDSGNFLPGHGGLLDRIDSLLAVAPMFFLIYWLLIRFTA